MVNRTLALIAMLSLFAAQAQAADPIGVSVSTTTLSQYLSSAGVSAHEDAVQQTDIYVELPRGFYVDFWGSFQLVDDSSGNFGDEVDFTVGWSGTEHGYTIDAGVSYFDIVPLGSSGGGGDFVQPYFQLEWPFNVVAPSHQMKQFVRLEYLIATDPAIDGGIYTSLGFQHKWSNRTGELKWVFTQKIYALYDDGVAGADNGLIGNYKAKVQWPIGENAYVAVPVVHFTKPLTSVDDGRGTERVIGLRFGFNF